MQTDQEQKETPREVALREMRTFDHWNGERKEGRWVPESVATTARRKYKHFAKSATEKDDRGRPKTVEVETEELVYMHHGYRPKMKGEAKTRKAFFFRGARVWQN